MEIILMSALLTATAVALGFLLFFIGCLLVDFFNSIIKPKNLKRL